VFGCPANAPAHRAIFAHVAGHVRAYYDLDPDLSGSDVARACFVSYDNGIWLNPSAAMLPGLAEIAKCYTEAMLCNRGERGTGLSSGDRLTIAYGLGESRASCSLRADGTAETNAPLMHLGKDLVVRYRKHNLALTGAEIDLAFNSWFASCRRQGFKFSKSRSDYRDELEKLVRSTERAPWLSRTVNRWLRWTHDPDYPSAGSAEDRLAFAIRKHCTEAGSPHFFLSARDAATIAGGHFVQANRSLHRLVRAGVLARVGKPLHARHAQNYRLIAKDGP
jgi:hypothetical protein